jgi:hypothetical protein
MRNQQPRHQLLQLQRESALHACFKNAKIPV